MKRSPNLYVVKESEIDLATAEPVVAEPALVVDVAPMASAAGMFERAMRIAAAIGFAPPDPSAFVTRAEFEVVTAELSRLRAEFAEFRTRVTVGSVTTRSTDTIDRARVALTGLDCVGDVVVMTGNPTVWVVFRSENLEGSELVVERLLAAGIRDFEFVPLHAAGMVADGATV